MRTTGSCLEAVGLGRHDHVSWTYDDPSTFVDAATAFLLEGARQGDRVGYIGGIGLDHMREVLDGLGDGSGPPATTFVTDIGAMYQEGAPDPEEQVDIYVRETLAAVRDGFRGLRVAADATLMALDPAAAREFARYEHLVDQAMLGMPFAAMCGYDVNVVGSHARSLACLHPATNDASSPFGVFAAGRGGVGLRGELDISTERALADALDAAGWPSSRHSTVDATAVDFIDHRALLLLQRRLEASDASVRLTCRSSVVADLIELLALDRIDAEVVR